MSRAVMIEQKMGVDRHMKVYSMYFSPTGGTKKAVDVLMEEWGGLSEIDLSVPNHNYGMYRFERGDVCIIGVPSFGGRVPAVALERLTKVRADHAAAVLVVSYGNRHYDDTILELRKAAESCGFCVVAAVAAVTEHSIMHQYGTGRPDEQDVAKLKEFAKAMKEKLLYPKRWKDFYVPGNYPYKEYGGVPLKPLTDDKCKSCGLCAKSCPVKAISRKNPSKTNYERCISCMRCIEICSQKARYLKKGVLMMAGFKLRKACAGRKENQLFM